MTQGHDIAEQACPRNQHELERVPGTTFAERCRKCGLSGQTLVDVLGHDLR